MKTATSFVGMLALGLCVAAAAPSAQAVCVGDCNGDGMVAINELILGVNIAQGLQPLSECPSFDADGSGDVGINELIAAVNNALNGCEPDGGCEGTERVYTVEPGILLAPPEGPDSTMTGLFTTGVGGANAAMSFSPGPLTIIMGSDRDAMGQACLRLKEDVTFSVDVVDSTCLCLKLLADDSEGSIDCDGGTSYDTQAVRTNGMAGLGWTATTGLGNSSGPGNANLLVQGLFERVMLTCAEADCPNHQYADPANLFAFTTASAEAIQETNDPNAPISLTVPGAPFECATWGTSAAGPMLAAPAPTTIDPIGNVANVFRLAEQAPTP